MFNKNGQLFSLPLGLMLVPLSLLLDTGVRIYDAII